MGHLDIDTALSWRGRTVRGADGEKIGTFGDVFLDQETDLPAWGGVKTGLFGHRQSYIPLDRVEEIEDDELAVPFDKQLVKDAPKIDPEVALSTEEEQALYAHYGREYVHMGGEERETAERETAIPEQERAAEPLGDDAMTRSEEEVSFHEGPMKPAERVRLKKVRVTENERRTVPVRKEVVQLEQDPPPEGRRVESAEGARESSRTPTADDHDGR